MTQQKGWWLLYQVYGVSQIKQLADKQLAVYLLACETHPWDAAGFVARMHTNIGVLATEYWEWTIESGLRPQMFLVNAELQVEMKMQPHNSLASQMQNVIMQALAETHSAVVQFSPDGLNPGK